MHPHDVFAMIANIVQKPCFLHQQAFGREIFAEHAPRQRHVWKLAMPMLVVFRRIGVDRFVLAAVHG
jgi:hypothetical protein